MTQPRWHSLAQLHDKIERDLHPLRDQLASFARVHPRFQNLVTPFLSHYDNGNFTQAFDSGEQMETSFRNLAALGNPEATQALNLIQTAIHGITGAAGTSGTFGDLRRHFTPTDQEARTMALVLQHDTSSKILHQNPVNQLGEGIMRLFRPSGP